MGTKKAMRQTELKVNKVPMGPPKQATAMEVVTDTDEVDAPQPEKPLAEHTVAESDDAAPQSTLGGWGEWGEEFVDHQGNDDATTWSGSSWRATSRGWQEAPGWAGRASGWARNPPISR